MQTQSEMLGIGLIAAVVIVITVSRVRGHDPWRALVIFTLSLALGAFGARAWAVAFSGAQWTDWGGFSSSGAILLGGIPALWLILTKNDDAPAIASGAFGLLVFLRFGCHLEGCDPGILRGDTRMPFALLDASNALVAAIIAFINPLWGAASYMGGRFIAEFARDPTTTAYLGALNRPQWVMAGGLLSLFLLRYLYGLVSRRTD